MTAQTSSSGSNSLPDSDNEEKKIVGEAVLYCQFCGRALEALFVNPAGELIGCESCADMRGLAGEMLTLEEWNTPPAVSDVLRQFGISDAEVRKPAPTPTQQPRTHY